MKEDVSAIRHRAFAVKLALRKVAAFYNEMKRARLTGHMPELEYFVAAPHLKILFDEFHGVHVRLETSLFEEMVRLSVEAEKAVNAYVKMHYGFGPGDDIRMGYPTAEGAVRLRVHKVFLQSGSDSEGKDGFRNWIITSGVPERHQPGVTSTQRSCDCLRARLFTEL